MMMLTAQTIGINGMAVKKPDVDGLVDNLLKVRLAFGRLEEWKKKVCKYQRAKLLEDGKIARTDIVVLATDKQINRLKSVDFKLKEFGKFEVVYDGHPKKYTVIAYPEGSTYPCGGFAPLTGRPITPGGNQRRNVLAYKLSYELADKLSRMAAKNQIDTDVHFELVFKGIERLKQDKRYGAVEFVRLEPGQRAPANAFRVSDAELALIDSVRRPGEANQAVVRRLIMVALEPELGKG